MNITMDTAEAIAKRASAEVYEDYSGRGMYGTKCLGFTVRDRQGEARLIGSIIRTIGDNEAEEFIDRLRTDSLGLGTIVYFPGITVAEEV